ncbi:Ig-like domain-containing protein, partial [Pseudomonas nitroreducens]
NRPTFSGSAEAGGKVIIYDNGTPIGTATVGDDGKWSFTPSSDLPEGNHAFTTEVLDKAGNSSGQGAPLNVVVDTSTVDVSIGHVIDAVGSITGDIAANGVTDDTRPEIDGKGKAGATITVYDGSVALGTTTVKPDGTWSFKPTTDLAEGPHSLKAESKDLAGNVSDSSTFNFSVDTTAPAKPSIGEVIDDVGAITGPIANGGVTDDSTPTLTGQAEAGSKVTVYDNG